MLRRISSQSLSDKAQEKFSLLRFYEVSGLEKVLNQVKDNY